MATRHYAKTGGVVTWSAGQMPMREGDSFDGDHPLVKERPDLFTTKLPPARVQTPRIERATRAPGEVRKS